MTRKMFLILGLITAVLFSGSLAMLFVVNPVSASHSCDITIRVNGKVTQSRLPIDPAKYPEFCGAEVVPTATPTNTPVPPTATSTPVPSPSHTPESMWHSPTDHEHGDAPPTWVTNSQWMPMFDHAGNTPNENVLKHTSFKGFTLSDDGVQLYVIAHLDTHPNGQQTRFHSVQVWALDPSGNISHWDTWMDFGVGDNALPNIRPNDACGNDGVRPIISVNFPDCPLTFESWYSRAGKEPWGWDFGFNISASYYGGPQVGTLSSGNLADSDTWLPTGNLNTTRRIEMAWYDFRSTQRGTFYQTQFGQLVSGPNDPVCGTQRTIGGRTYTVLCLEQYIAPTLPMVSFPGNSVQKSYPSNGVILPN